MVNNICIHRFTSFTIVWPARCFASSLENQVNFKLIAFAISYHFMILMLNVYILNKVTIRKLTSKNPKVKFYTEEKAYYTPKNVFVE